MSKHVSWSQPCVWYDVPREWEGVGLAWVAMCPPPPSKKSCMKPWNIFIAFLISGRALSLEFAQSHHPHVLTELPLQQKRAVMTSLRLDPLIAMTTVLQVMPRRRPTPAVETMYPTNCHQRRGKWGDWWRGQSWKSNWQSGGRIKRSSCN